MTTLIHITVTRLEKASVDNGFGILLLDPPSSER
jgi:hypothetical protein